MRLPHFISQLRPQRVVFGQRTHDALAPAPESSPHPHGDFDEEAYYEIRTVLAERLVGKRIECQVDWEDNKRTGEKYPPTWEPRSFLTPAALADWEAIKLARLAGVSNIYVCDLKKGDQQRLVPPEKSRLIVVL